jgi:hypothetical protein
VIVFLLPTILSAFLALSLAGVAPPGVDGSHALIVMVLWLLVIDYGTYPARLIKRLRPIFLTYDISLPAIFVAATQQALLNALVRIISIVAVLGYANISWAGLASLWAPLLVLGSFGFSLGLLLAAVSKSLFEVFLFGHHLFFALGFVSGFFTLPAVLSFVVIEPLNPLRAIARHCYVLLGSSPQVGGNGVLLSYVVVLVLSGLALYYSRRLMIAISLV